MSLFYRNYVKLNLILFRTLSEQEVRSFPVQAPVCWLIRVPALAHHKLPKHLRSPKFAEIFHQSHRHFPEWSSQAVLHLQRRQQLEPLHCSGCNFLCNRTHFSIFLSGVLVVVLGHIRNPQVTVTKNGCLVEYDVLLRIHIGKQFTDCSRSHTFYRFQKNIPPLLYRGRSVQQVG